MFSLQFYVSLLVFGLLWFAGGIMIRSCAIYDFYKYKEEKVVSRNEWKPNLWMVLLMIVDGILVLVWVIVFKLETHNTGVNVSIGPIYTLYTIISIYNIFGYISDFCFPPMDLQ